MQAKETVTNAAPESSARDKVQVEIERRMEVLQLQCVGFRWITYTKKLGKKAKGLKGRKRKERFEIRGTLTFSLGNLHFVGHKYIGEERTRTESIATDGKLIPDLGSLWNEITSNDDGGSRETQTSFAFVSKENIEQTTSWVQYNTLRYDVEAPGQSDEQNAVLLNKETDAPLGVDIVENSDKHSISKEEDFEMQQMQQMREKMEQIEERLMALELKNEELTRKNEELTRKNEELTRKNEELTRKNEELTRKNEELSINNDKWLGLFRELVSDGQRLFSSAAAHLP